MTTTTTPPKTTFVRRDIQQQVTDTIISQLEAGTVPWQKPWTGNDNAYSFTIPKNTTTGNKYRGINILLLWGSAIQKDFNSSEWASLKQWNGKNERIRKDEKGTMIVYYDTIEREVDGEIKKIPFLKSSIVFNRCQLASYNPEQDKPQLPEKSLIERIASVDDFITNTKAIVQHEGFRACYIPSQDKIMMPYPEAFKDTDSCTATENYYSTLAHELTHWSGSPKRLQRTFGKNFGDDKYAEEELTAELGAAFLCAEFGINIAEKGNNASYIAHWLEILKNNKQCLFTAAREASRAVDFLQGLQPG
jgi:antirestriction protein ArdC